MPVVIKDFTWSQSKDVIIIHVPLKGVHSSRVDLFTADNYIKASFPPFLFEVFLSAAVQDSDSKCTFTEGEITLELHKIETGDWESLEAALTKEQKKDLRAEIVEKAHQIAEAEAKAKNEKKAELQRLAVRKQIAFDSLRLDTIKRIKDNEKASAMLELETWKTQQAIKNLAIEPSVPESKVQLKMITSGLVNSQPKTSFGRPNTQPKNKTKKVALTKLTTKQQNTVRKKVDKPMPLPREGGNIAVDFTPRIFPTPSRESKHIEEEEWLKTQYEARKNVGFVAEDLSQEEQDPVWLKEKGDSFFQLHNYLGAVSAYSHAIKLGSKMPSLYSNRAAAHMALGNLHKVVEDCSTALELLKPCIELNAEARLKCHVRRGTALCRLGLAKHGMHDMEAAMKLKPNNEELKVDWERAKALADDENTDEEFQ